LKSINPNIFRESDIRGLVKTDLTPDHVENIGKAIGTYLKRQGGKVITIGRDVRNSSKKLRDIIVQGVLSTGCDLKDIGVVPTPVSYFAQHHLGTDGGIMITGSHNPSRFNGFKINAGGNSLYGDKIREIFRLIMNQDYETGRGTIDQIEVVDSYIEKISEIITIPREVKLAVDGGNGCFGIVGPRLFKKLGLEPIEVFCNPDGNFPNHHPDPTVAENLQDLIQVVKREGCELGIGFDGDVDRIGAVDETGTILWGDQLLTIFAREILSKHPGATIVGEVKCSQNLFQDIKNRGGNPVMAAAGHSLIKKKMRETNALLAGEMSGHIFFADNYFGYDDAMFAACRLLQIISTSDKKLSEMLTDLPKTFNTPEIRIECPDNQKFAITQDIGETFKNKYEVIETDGFRINFPHGWGLIRASNTQPILVLRFESQSKEGLREIMEVVNTKLLKYDCFSSFSPEEYY
jgi:phosphomannomutase/phosphoglucomutase